jgi:hypothetical protein
MPVHAWIPGWIDTRITTKPWDKTYTPYTGIWSTESGKALEQTLLNCRSQCWDCHKCERVFGMSDIDSALQIRKGYTPN